MAEQIYEFTVNKLISDIPDSIQEKEFYEENSFEYMRTYSNSIKIYNVCKIISPDYKNCVLSITYYNNEGFIISFYDKNGKLQGIVPLEFSCYELAKEDNTGLKFCIKFDKNHGINIRSRPVDFYWPSSHSETRYKLRDIPKDMDIIFGKLGEKGKYCKQDNCLDTNQEIDIKINNQIVKANVCR